METEADIVAESDRGMEGVVVADPDPDPMTNSLGPVSGPGSALLVDVMGMDRSDVNVAHVAEAGG